MWKDECGFKHNGPSPYEQRKLTEFRSRITIEEKYKEKKGAYKPFILNNLISVNLSSSSFQAPHRFVSFRLQLFQN